MIAKLITLAFFFVAASACDTTWPNTTETAVTWWQCGGVIDFKSATPQDATGAYEYPIHLSKPLIIHTQGNNPTQNNGANLKQTINVWSWSASCSWSSVPTFGLLKNLPACDNGTPCPLKAGLQYFDFELDFSDYGAIINLLKDDAPYQLQYDIHDTSLGDVACLIFQARAYIN